MIGDYLAGFAAEARNIPGLRSAETWDGAWDPAASAARMSLRAPALLVGMLGFLLEADDLLDLEALGVDAAGATGEGQLASREVRVGLALADAARRGLPSPDLPPVPSLGLQPQLRLAATIVTSGGKLDDRAREALNLVPPVVRLAVASAWHGVACESLAAPELRDKGVTVVTVTGWRQVVLLPELAAPADTSRLTVCMEGLE